MDSRTAFRRLLGLTKHTRCFLFHNRAKGGIGIGSYPRGSVPPCLLRRRSDQTALPSHSFHLQKPSSRAFTSFASSYSTHQLDRTNVSEGARPDQVNGSRDGGLNQVLEEAQVDFHPFQPFKVLDSHGRLASGNRPPDLGEMGQKEFSVRAYTLMVKLVILDTTMNNLQRHGRISFYMTSDGEEGAVVGSAAAWGPSDEVFAQYREQGILLWRGCSLDYLMAQCFSSAADKGSRGRQMPMHYASKEFHFYSISSPLATQIPQAAGAAYALKRMKLRGERQDDCVICYVGEGAASEGDFHAGVNMASVLGGPIVFFIRNNGFAISTPSSQQFKGDGISSRAAGYGIDAIRVDGNDPLAVYLASKEARRRAMQGDGRAVMLEAMTYRVGHHSTSDDSNAYRNASDVEQWRKKDNPIHRMRMYLEDRGWWSQADEDELKKNWKAEISKSTKLAETMPKPPLSEMWKDIYANEESHLIEQRKESEMIIKKWKSYKPYQDELSRFQVEDEGVDKKS